ncbi:MAG: enoyl-CoA hydratase-related protein [Proteobacteria bacterium]|jgi:enoyl-CoA hydratase/carnithine racemase|nr:enoyl-CoA hydratase-related protein [Pseudomonadota bacterium]
MGTIRIETRGDDVFLITIDRADRRNAFDEPLLDEWVARLAEIAPRAPRAVVITGAGDAFSAGYDVRGIDPAQDPRLPLPDARFERAIRAVLDLPCPAVAAVNGDAFGGGLDLALACDLCLVAPDAKLAMTPCRLGLVYSADGVARLVSRLGAALARRMFLTALPIDAAEAARAGAVEIVEPKDALLPRALGIASRIASNAPLAVRGTRTTVEAVEGAIARSLSTETRALLRDLRILALQSDDLKEGLAAFAEKRPPRFRGE